MGPVELTEVLHKAQAPIPQRSLDYRAHHGLLPSMLAMLGAWPTPKPRLVWGICVSVKSLLGSIGALSGSPQLLVALALQQPV